MSEEALAHKLVTNSDAISEFDSEEEPETRNWVQRT